MELKIVSKEIALQLKELGFDWIPKEPHHIWLCKNEANPGYEQIRAITESDMHNKWFIGEYSIPTQALCIKWLRDVHNIYFHIDYSNQHDLYAIHWEVPKMESSSVIRPNYKTSELAEEAGILKALEILKSKQNESNI